MAQKKVDKVLVLTDDNTTLGLYLTLYKSKRWNKLVIQISKESGVRFKGTRFCKQISAEVAV